MSANRMRVGQIPRSVIMAVGEALGLHYYHHRALETLFVERGAPGDPPDGNCVEKCQQWLKRCNEDPNVDAYSVLGGVLEDFMDCEVPEGGRYLNDELPGRREKVRRALARVGLSYQFGGQVVGPGTGGAARLLQEVLRQRDLAAIEIEFKRSLSTVETDPPSAATAACAILEALCKVIIEDEGLEEPNDKSIKGVWRIVQGYLGLDPAKLEDRDLAKVLSGLTSVVDGLGSYRTHAGSAHGRGRTTYRVRGRHARLVINAAHTLTLFVLETWDDRRRAAPADGGPSTTRTGGAGNAAPGGAEAAGSRAP